MTFQGLIYRDEQGHLVQKITAGQSPALARPENIIFLAAAPTKDQVSAVLDAVYRVACHMDQDEEYLPSSPVQEGGVYVYAYGRDAGAKRFRRSECFYVGKGVGPRWTQHVWKRANDAARGITAVNAKEKAIQSWIETQGTEVPRVLRKLAAGTVVRKMGTWTGAHADSQAFAVEYFLISRLGVHAIANDTNGNVKSKDLVIMTTPSVPNKTSQGLRKCWAGAVAAFTANPSNPAIHHTWNPLLLLLKLEPLIGELDEVLVRAGFDPLALDDDRELLDEMELPRHLRVAGSADAILTYSSKEAHVYRLDLKLSATKNIAGINLRPIDNSGAANEAFLNYFDTRLRGFYPDNIEPVKHRNGSPFFKPFAPDANGSRSTRFSIEDLGQAETGTTNWIAGNFKLSLVEAMQLVVKEFSISEPAVAAPSA